MAVQKWKFEVRAVKREVFMIIIIMFRIYGNNVNIILCPEHRTCAGALCDENPLSFAMQKNKKQKMF